jgi:hypothetical protein
VRKYAADRAVLPLVGRSSWRLPSRLPRQYRQTRCCSGIEDGIMRAVHRQNSPTQTRSSNQSPTGIWFSSLRCFRCGFDFHRPLRNYAKFSKISAGLRIEDGVLSQQCKRATEKNLKLYLGRVAKTSAIYGLLFFSRLACVFVNWGHSCSL